MLVTAKVEVLCGHLRYGHYECYIDSIGEQEKFKAMSEKDKKEYIEEHGDLLVDDYEVDDVDGICDILIQE